MNSQVVVLPGLIDRLNALIVDSLLFGIFFSILIYISVFIQADYFLEINAVLWCVLQTLTTYRYGATPGKIIYGLQVITTDFKSISFKTAVVRTFFNNISCLIIVYFIFLMSKSA